MAIFAGVRGFLDNIEIADIGGFEQSLLALMRDKQGDLLAVIRDEGAISDDSEKKLLSIIEDFAKSFS